MRFVREGTINVIELEELQSAILSSLEHSIYDPQNIVVIVAEGMLA